MKVKLFDLLEQYENVQVPADALVIALVRKKGQKAGAVVREGSTKLCQKKGSGALTECVQWAAENRETTAALPQDPGGEYVEFAHVNGSWYCIEDGMVLAKVAE